MTKEGWPVAHPRFNRRPSARMMTPWPSGNMKRSTCRTRTHGFAKAWKHFCKVDVFKGLELLNSSPLTHVNGHCIPPDKALEQQATVTDLTTTQQPTHSSYEGLKTQIITRILFSSQKGPDSKQIPFQPMKEMTAPTSLGAHETLTNGWTSHYFETPLILVYDTKA